LGNVARVTAVSARTKAVCPNAAEAPIKSSNFKRYLDFKSIFSKRKENVCRNRRARPALTSKSCTFRGMLTNYTVGQNRETRERRVDARVGV
jgi:hypothetical protein